MDQLKVLLDNWVLLGEGLVGSIGCLAFLDAWRDPELTA